MSKYPKELDEYLKIKIESFSNNYKIARMAIKEFGLDQDRIEAIRQKTAILRKNLYKEGRKFVPKRLFFDIETGYYKTPVFGCFKQFVRPEMLEGEKKIICISYLWQGEDKVKTLKWKRTDDGFCDKEMVREFIKIMGGADEIIGHNGDKFDIKELRTRALLNNVLMFPKYRTLDTLKKSRSFFRFPSNKLDYLGDVTEIGRKKEHAGFDLWRRCQEGWSKDNPNIKGTVRQIQNEALKEMVEYCEQDVILLSDYFHLIAPFIDHNTNFAVIKDGLRGKWKCPECTSENVELSHTDTTPLGYVKRHMKCNDCKKFYHVSNRTYTQFITKDLYSE